MLDLPDHPLARVRRGAAPIHLGNSSFSAKLAVLFGSTASPFLLSAAFICLVQVCSARAGGLTVSDAWVPASHDVGGDVPLMAAIRNEANSPDVLLRVRCPVANFSEKHIVDRGEGTPAMRAVPSIPIAASNTVVLKPDGYHLMLLQTRQPLTVGNRFSCTFAFQKAGAIETEVEVRRSP